MSRKEDDLRASDEADADRDSEVSESQATSEAEAAAPSKSSSAKAGILPPPGPRVPVEAILPRIQRATSIVQGRMRLARVIGVTPVVVPLALLFTATILAAHKVYPYLMTEALAWRLFFVVVGTSIATWVIAAVWPLAPNAGAVALDRQHGLDGRLTNALEFAAVPAEQRTPLMQAAIDEACQFVAERPKKQTLTAAVAAPLFAAAIVSWWLFPLLLVPSAGILTMVTLFELRTPIPPPEKQEDKTTKANPVDLTKDDLDAFRDAAEELQRPDQSPEMKAAIDKFNKLIDDLAAKRLDTNEALRQMEALDRELMTNAKEDRERLSRELRETAKQLEKSDLAKDLADALKKDDLKKAEEEMKKLSEKVKDPKTKLDREKLQKLRDALKKASEQRKQALAAIEKKRAEMKEQLLKKKQQIEQEKDPKKREEEEKLLKKKERELEQLDRDAERQQAANRQLEQLDRELAEAAAALAKELGLTPEELAKAAQELQDAAKDLNRLEKESMSEKEKQELKEKLEELRELIRQQNKGGKKRQTQLKKFSKKANGKGGKKSRSKSGEQGEQGEEGEDGEQGEGEEEGEGEEGDGKEGEGDGEGEGEGEGEGQKGQKGKKGKKGQGSGEGEGDGVELSLGPGGVPIPMPGQGEGPGGEQPGPGGGKGGKEWGTGSGGPIAGDATDPNMGTQHVEAQGNETNQGSSATQTIRSAAEKGFRGNDYKKWFGEYKTVAEENIAQEDIPDGYRFYVQRYFQLIRPRD